MNPDSPTWEELVEQIRQTFRNGNLNATVNLVLTDIGRNVYVRTSGESPEVLSDHSAPADLELKMSMADGTKIVQRKLGPRKAIMTGKLKTKGNLALAWQVATLFDKPLPVEAR